MKWADKYLDQGKLVYEYNMMIIEQYSTTSEVPLSAGKHTIDIDTNIAGPGQPGTVALSVDGKQVGSVALKKTVPLAFTASETFDVGIDLGSPVSLKYDDRRPFAFDGKIHQVSVQLK